MNCPKCIVPVTRAGNVFRCPLCKREWRDEYRNNQSDTVKVVQGELEISTASARKEVG